jgi:flagellar biosynthesis/type III secretory pathway protein FliH
MKTDRKLRREREIQARKVLRQELKQEVVRKHLAESMSFAYNQGHQTGYKQGWDEAYEKYFHSQQDVKPQKEQDPEVTEHIETIKNVIKDSKEKRTSGYLQVVASENALDKEVSIREANNVET